jgi:hypothetical protein
LTGKKYYFSLYAEEGDVPLMRAKVRSGPLRAEMTRAEDLKADIEAVLVIANGEKDFSLRRRTITGMELMTIRVRKERGGKAYTANLYYEGSTSPVILPSQVGLQPGNSREQIDFLNGKGRPVISVMPSQRSGRMDLEIRSFLTEFHAFACLIAFLYLNA